MIRRRIAAVSNIQQVTRAMQMIAASRVRKAQEATEQTRPYATKLETLMQHMATVVAQGEHPLLSQRPLRRATIIVVTADRGLCRGFNSNAIRHAIERYNELQEQGAEVELITVGRRASDFFRRRGGAYNVVARHAGIFQHLEFLTAQQIALQAVERFTSGATDRVELVYNEFRNLLVQELVTKQFLPLEPVAPSEGESIADYIYEPNKELIWERLISKYVDLEIWRVLLESNAAEQAARMTAMEEATNNAADMIKNLISVRNKVRQASITKELTEIVGGSEALE